MSQKVVTLGNSPRVPDDQWRLEGLDKPSTDFDQDFLKLFGLPDGFIRIRHSSREDILLGIGQLEEMYIPEDATRLRSKMLLFLKWIERYGSKHRIPNH